jgi:hypothetical protein
MHTCWTGSDSRHFGGNGSLNRAGRCLPHPRHWLTQAKLAGIDASLLPGVEAPVAIELSSN